MLTPKYIFIPVFYHSHKYTDIHISLASPVIKYHGQKQHKEYGFIVAYNSRGTEYNTAGEPWQQAAGARTWLITFHPYTGSREKE